LSRVGESGQVQVDNFTSVLLRILQGGGLDLGQVATGGTIQDVTALELALENLDSTPNVTVNTTDDQDGDGNPDVLFTVAALGFNLKGIVDLKVNATVPGGGKVELSGSLNITAVVDLHLRFGVGTKNGFFLLPSLVSEPALSVHDITVSGEVSGQGRIGFLGVDIHAATLSLDSNVKVTFSLTDPGTVAADGKIQIPELTPENFRDLISVAVVGDAADGLDDDVTLVGTFGVGVIVPGFNDSLNLFDANLTLKWADATEPTHAEISAVGAAQRFLEFLNVTSQNVLDELIVVKDQLSVFSVDIP
jgi:hypothetical protein